MRYGRNHFPFLICHFPFFIGNQTAKSPKDRRDRQELKGIKNHCLSQLKLLDRNLEFVSMVADPGVLWALGDFAVSVVRNRKWK